MGSDRRIDQKEWIPTHGSDVAPQSVGVRTFPSVTHRLSGICDDKMKFRSEYQTPRQKTSTANVFTGKSNNAGMLRTWKKKTGANKW